MYTADQTKDIHVAFERQHKNIGSRGPSDRPRAQEAPAGQR